MMQLYTGENPPPPLSGKEGALEPVFAQFAKVVLGEADPPDRRLGARSIPLSKFKEN